MDDNEFSPEQDKEYAWELAVGKVYDHLDWCKSSADRRDSEDVWTDCQNFYLGKQWDGVKSFGIPGRPADLKRIRPCPVENYFKAFIDGIVGDVCDRPADIQIGAVEPSDEEVAADLAAGVKHVWDFNHSDRKMEFIVQRACLYGPLLGKVYWDNSVKGPAYNKYQGEVRFIGIPPTQIFIDPRIKAADEAVLENAAFIMYCVKRSLTYIRNTWPKDGEKVQPDSYANYVTTLSGDETEIVVDPNDQEALVVEYWYKGEPFCAEYPSSSPTRDRKDKNVHKMIVAGNVLLEHKTNVASSYPFVMEWVSPDDSSIYSKGDGYDALMPQLVLNKLNELAIEGADLASQGTWITEEGNVRNAARFQKYGRTGGVLQSVIDIGKLKHEPGQNVPGSLFAHYRQSMQALETITGRTDLAQGRTSRRVEAASAIALLLQQSGGRVRKRARAVNSFVTQVVDKIIALIGENYTEDRVVRLIGPTGSGTRVINNKNFLREKVYTNPLTGEVSKEKYIPQFDILVNVGTETPTSKAYFSQTALQLFQMGVIDEIALLEMLQYPKWKEILQRKKQIMMEQQQAAAAQQQTTPPQMMPPEMGAAPAGMEQEELTPDKLAMLMQMLSQEGGGGEMY